MEPRSLRNVKQKSLLLSYPSTGLCFLEQADPCIPLGNHVGTLSGGVGDGTRASGITFHPIKTGKHGVGLVVIVVIIIDCNTFSRLSEGRQSASVLNFV